MLLCMRLNAITSPGAESPSKASEYSSGRSVMECGRPVKARRRPVMSRVRVSSISSCNGRVLIET
jgi:hypothetical protein